MIDRDVGLRPETSVRRLAVGAVMLISIAINFRHVLSAPAVYLGGDPDAVAMALWHTWWPQFGLLLPDALALTAYSGAPFMANHLRYMPILQSFLFGAFNRLVDPVLAMNLVLMSCQAATHYFLYRMLRTLPANYLLALAGATAFVLSPWYSSKASQSDVIAIALWPLPLAITMWSSWLRSPRTMLAIILAGVVWLAVLNGLQNMAWIVALLLPYFVYTWSRQRALMSHPPSGHLRNGDQVALICLLLTVLLLLYPAPNVVRTTNSGEAAYAAADSVASGGILNLLMRTAPAVWFCAALVLVTPISIRSARPWFVLGAANIVFALGLLPGPLDLVSGALRLRLSALHTPDAFWPPAMLAMTVFAVLGWTKWQRTQPSKTAVTLTVIVAVGLVGAGIISPADRGLVQHTSGAASAFYAQVAGDPEDFLILQYPFGLHNLQDGQATGGSAHLVQYAVWHHKRTLSGVAPHFTPAVHAAFAEVPFLHPLGDASDSANTAVKLAQAVQEWRIGYVVLHTELLDEHQQGWLKLLVSQSNALCPGVQRGSLLVFRARWYPAGCLP